SSKRDWSSDVCSSDLIFQLDPLSHKGAAAVLATEQAAVSENSLARCRPGMAFFPRLEKYLRLLPDLPGHNDGKIVLVPELLRLQIGRASCRATAERP